MPTPGSADHVRAPCASDQHRIDGLETDGIFKQVLDHFGANGGATFDQRYFVNSRYADPTNPNAPIAPRLNMFVLPVDRCGWARAVAITSPFRKICEFYHGVAPHSNREARYFLLAR